MMKRKLCFILLILVMTLSGCSMFDGIKSDFDKLTQVTDDTIQHSPFPPSMYEYDGEDTFRTGKKIKNKISEWIDYWVFWE